MWLLLACTKTPLVPAWEEGLSINDPALIDDEGLIIGVSDSTMRAMDARTGGTKWSVDLPEGAGGTPVVTDDNTILVWSELGVFGLDTAGEIVFSRNAEMFVEVDPAITADGTILVMGENLDKDAAVLAKMTLDAGLVSQVEFGAARPVTQPAIDDDGDLYVVVVSTAGVYSLAKLDGDGVLLWQIELPEGMDHTTEVIPAAGLWIVGNGLLQELDPANGDILDDDIGAYVVVDADGAVIRSEDQLEIHGREDIAIEFPNLTCGHATVDVDGQVYAACSMPNDPGRTVVIDAKEKVRIGDPAEWAGETQLASPMLWEDVLIFRLEAGLIAYEGAAPPADSWSRSRGGLRNQNRIH